MDEADFQETVADRLEDRYRRVEHEPRLPSGREPDFVVETWLFTLVIEVEHNPDDVTDDVIHGAGQALEYAGELGLVRRDAGVVPVVICNADGLQPDSPEVQGVRSRMPVVPLSQ